MRLYMIETGGERDYVEAATMEDAIGIWRAAWGELVARDQALPTMATAEPDQIAMMADVCYTRAVLRAGEFWVEE